MRKLIPIISAVLLLFQSAWGKHIIGASLPDLASIAAAVGGDRVETFSITRSVSDPHFVEVLPSYMVKVARSSLYLKSGLNLDQWADQILDGARNPKIRVIDCSRGINILEKPSTKIDASMGDIHPDGNPHYWLDPANGLIIAQTIFDALCLVDPEGSIEYKVNYDKFTEELQQKINKWKTQAAALSFHEIITYHNSWVYFADAFGFEIAAKIEPVPGIPPTASHLVNLVKIIRERKINIVIQEPYFSDDSADYLRRETGVRIVKLAPSCDNVSATSYLDHFQMILDTLQAVG